MVSSNHRYKVEAGEQALGKDLDLEILPWHLTWNK